MSFLLLDLSGAGFARKSLVGCLVRQRVTPSEMKPPKLVHRASFRDPAGFVFEEQGTLFRFVSSDYRDTFREAERGGLLPSLVESGLLIPYQKVKEERDEGCLILQPERLRFVSYPYEWSFSQLRDASLVTLEIQRRCLQKGFWLKDASAYNIQFHRGKPVLVDLLSFERVKEGQPWPAYRQFCQHFLAPLALMSYRHPRLSILFHGCPDGIPLGVAVSVLGWRGFFNFWLSVHLRAHARSAQKYLRASAVGAGRFVSRQALLGLVDSLESAVLRLRCPDSRGFWAEYSGFEPYSPEAREDKMVGVGELADAVFPSPRVVWDIGANTGDYSWLMASRGAFTVAMDSEWECVEKIYEKVKQTGEVNVLPLVQDVANPSSSSGVGQEERSGLKQRGPADLVFVLALIHHLRITCGIPFSRLAEYLSLIARWLIVEYVPKSDPKVRGLLDFREDIFEDYHEDEFRRSFGKHFLMVRRRPIKGSGRVLYLMRRKGL